MSEATAQSLLMATIGLAALVATHRLPAAFTAVQLPAITVGADEEKHPASGRTA
jgi:hypothetical protein